jgi:hypothetical protein
MSLFSWFSSKKPEKHQAAAPSSGLSRMESTKPYSASRHEVSGQGQPANRKHERMARRELLYMVVRDTMVNAGVLSSSYKFKVLSLDSRGRQFLVMVDLAQGAGGDTVRLAEIEASIAQSAKSRYDIVVTAVYWRSNEHVAVGDSRGALKPGAVSRPAPLTPHSEARSSAPAPLQADPISQPAELIAAPLTRSHSRYEPLQPDEVTAFRKALASGVTGAEALAVATNGASAKSFDGSEKHGPQSYTLLTGFEDTEMAESDTPTPTALSSTQYGDLR